MAKITGITNFTGTIDGLVFYMVNGQQFFRAEKAKTNQTKSKELPKILLPGIEALQVRNALHSMNHLVNAMEKEFQPLKTPKPTGADLHTDNSKSPVLENAVRDNTEIKFTVRGTKTDLYLIILQINFETGDFRRKKIAIAEAHCIRKNTYTVETEYQVRKGYTDLLFLYGHHFLKAVPIKQKKGQEFLS
ncbi:hypothetical protein KSK37_08180 [Kaistella sp. DKR-2]|uniref:hypothetical protein n=1 Tax=Kaistella soli TaxID=2849654 RepID=UPI001C2753A1|nr:hypothetical protein [Kaistella soli]MBU8883056.1 hypothetical protein [Kaistella soli]